MNQRTLLLASYAGPTERRGRSSVSWRELDPSQRTVAPRWPLHARPGTPESLSS